MNEPTADARAVWEEHYGAKPRVWSGRVNARVAEIVPQLSGTRALDLGCGEGADAIWLARHGWTVLAVDISDTALDRARTAAAAAGVADRIDFARHDLGAGFPEGSFDLVSAQFLHSTVAMDRPAILRRAAAAVAPGGTLLIVDHAAAPPWASTLHHNGMHHNGMHHKGMHHHEFPSAEDVLDGLDLDPAQWARVRVERAERVARGPDGQQAVLVDNVMVLRRTRS